MGVPPPLPSATETEGFKQMLVVGGLPWVREKRSSCRRRRNL